MGNLKPPNPNFGEDAAYAKYLRSLELLGNGVPISRDAFVCFMCGEEFGAQPRRCSRCNGTLFEYLPGQHRKIEESVLTIEELKARSGRKTNKEKAKEKALELECEQINATVSQ